MHIEVGVHAPDDGARDFYDGHLPSLPVQGRGVARTSREGDRDEKAVSAATSITLRNGACLVTEPCSKHGAGERSHHLRQQRWTHESLAPGIITGQSVSVRWWEREPNGCIVRAVAGQDAGYPFDVRTVADEDWVSQFAAAGAILSWHDRNSLSTGQLEPVHNGARQAGVSRVTVERQSRRRRGVGPVRRLKLLLSDALRSVANSV